MWGPRTLNADDDDDDHHHHLFRKCQVSSMPSYGEIFSYMKYNMQEKTIN